MKIGHLLKRGAFFENGAFFGKLGIFGKFSFIIIINIILNFLIQNLFPVVLTPADLWYHAWFPRYCQSALFVTKQQE